MPQKYCLSQKELARRWGLSHRTLERWRYAGCGPAFLKLGGRVLYRQADIEAFEQSQLQRARIGDRQLPSGRVRTSHPPNPHHRALEAC